ncbi:MAG: diacylglycerol kinase family lipid kinase [Acidobacteriota bacterium]|nr:diacylglycerol kinase family lipid kinase [Acidobacteriota bacterium]
MLNGIHDALLIHNPAAGRRRNRRARDLDAACRILGEAGIRVELAATSRAGDGTNLAREAVRSRRGMVIGCGGDGTINEIVNGLAGSRVPLAVLPAGTANVLGKELGLPWNIPAAARLILTGRLERIALGLARVEPPDGPERYFICIAGAGVDGSMVYSVNSRLKQATGTLAYWLAGLGHFFTYPLIPFRVAVDDHSFQAAQVIVGRTKHYGGPFRITPGADLLSDRFQAAVFTTTSRFRYPAHMVAVWLSRLERQGDVHFVDTRCVRCEARPGDTIYVELDGEPAGRLPAEFRIVPDALTLVMPENETK